MTSLILDTTGLQAFLAVAKKGSLSAKKIIAEGRQLSKFLLPSIQTILQETVSHPVEGRALDFIAIGIGPGSFTGTRVGGMVAKSLSFAWNIPLISFSSSLLPDLETIGRITYEKFISGESSSEIELVYIPPTP